MASVYTHKQRIEFIDRQTLSHVIRKIRKLLDQSGFEELYAPRLVDSTAIEAYIDPIAVATEQGNQVLQTSAEFFLKKNFQKTLTTSPHLRGIYDIGSVFRNDRPGKNHLIEFTMVEWYEKEGTIDALLTTVSQFIACVAEFSSESRSSSSLLNPPIPKVLRMVDLFQSQGLQIDFTNPLAFQTIYLRNTGSLPHHVNALDAEITSFNLLFDEFITPQLQALDDPIAVWGFPECLAAMAYTANGVAKRFEVFWRGLEIGNGYREEYRSDELKKRWNANNEIRRLRSLNEHPIDEAVLEAAHDMRGVYGMAVGVERLIHAWSIASGQ